MAADYSIVKDKATGKFSGFWLRDPDVARRPMMLATLLMMNDAGELRDDAFAGNYRVVPNTVDGNGGCFVLFGSAAAPGEGSVPAKKWWQFWK